MRYADVGRIDVAIDVVISDVAVALFANVIGQPAYRQKIGRFVKRDAVFKRKALARQDFISDGLQVCVGDGQFSHDSLYSIRWHRKQRRYNDLGLN